LTQRPVETSAIHRYQLTQVLDAQPALQWHQFSDVIGDAFPPESKPNANSYCFGAHRRATK
jgi:hypothetical protein